jgi:hypothetical protein
MPPPKNPSKPFLSFFKSLSCLSQLKQLATIQKSAELEDTYSTMSEDDPRYDACTVLYDAGIPCLIWGEDALALYGVPTIILELFLLVHDPERAARSLEAAGYSRTKVNPRFEHIPQLSIHAPRLAIPPKGSNIKGGDLTEVDESNTVGVVLLSAREWKYNLCRDPRKPSYSDSGHLALGRYKDVVRRVSQVCHRGVSCSASTLPPCI